MEKCQRPLLTLVSLVDRVCRTDFLCSEDTAMYGGRGMDEMTLGTLLLVGGKSGLGRVWLEWGATLVRQRTQMQNHTAIPSKRNLLNLTIK